MANWAVAFLDALAREQAADRAAREQGPNQADYTLNGNPINAGDFTRFTIRDADGNYSERIILERKHLEFARSGLRDWVQGSLEEADFQRLKGLVLSSHLIDVSDPKEDNWRCIYRGTMRRTTELLSNRISSCPIQAVIEQARAAYIDVIRTGDPSISLCQRQAKGERLQFVRAVVPQKDGRLRVGIDYEDPVVRPQSPPRPLRG